MSPVDWWPRTGWEKPLVQWFEAQSAQHQLAQAPSLLVYSERVPRLAVVVVVVALMDLSFGCGRSGYEVGSGEVRDSAVENLDATSGSDADTRDASMNVGVCPPPMPMAPCPGSGTTAPSSVGELTLGGDTRVNGGENFAACGAAGAAEYTIQLFSANGDYQVTASADYDIVVYAVDGCGGTVISGCEDSAGPGGTEVLVFTTTTRTPVIVVDSADGDCGTVTVAIDPAQ